MPKSARDKCVNRSFKMMVIELKGTAQFWCNKKAVDLKGGWLKLIAEGYSLLGRH